MRRQRMLVLVALASALALSWCAQPGTAGRLSFSITTFRSAAAPIGMWGEAGLGGPISFTCDLTIIGSFHTTTWTKTLNNLLARVTDARFNQASCIGGRAYVLNGEEILAGSTVAEMLPFHMQYSGFTGTLPAITAIALKIIGFALLINTIGEFGEPVVCLYRSTLERPMVVRFNISSGRITGMQQEEAGGIPLFSGGMRCPALLQTSGQGTVTVPERVTSVSVRLI